MAYELADYYGGEATAKQIAALVKARAAKKAGKAPKIPSFVYSTDAKTKGKCRKNPKANPNRSKYMGCKLGVLHQIPCEYRTKENRKALTPWANQYCPAKERKKGLSSAMEQVKAEAKKLGIRVTHIKNGKRVAKSKSMLLSEVLNSAGYN
jgi:hypothetical protein